MGGKKSDPSVTYIKTSSKRNDSTGGYERDYVKTSFENSNDKENIITSFNDEEEEVNWLDLPIKSSTKKVRLCTMCGRFKGIKMRRKYFILLCIAIVLLLILVGALLVLYVIVPAIVRSTIEKVELSFRWINIEDIKNDSFRLRAELELSRTGSIAATILSPLVIH
ncbi:unnamed protein product, partial [Adineta ricciae]